MLIQIKRQDHEILIDSMSDPTLQYNCYFCTKQTDCSVHHASQSRISSCVNRQKHAQSLWFGLISHGNRKCQGVVTDLLIHDSSHLDLIGEVTIRGFRTDISDPFSLECCNSFDVISEVMTSDMKSTHKRLIRNQRWCMFGFVGHFTNTFYPPDRGKKKKKRSYLPEFRMSFIKIGHKNH